MNGEDQAFPSGVQADNYASPGACVDFGLKIRDYIAIQVMASLVTQTTPDTLRIAQEIAKIAYLCADALINESNTIPKDKLKDEPL